MFDSMTPEKLQVHLARSLKTLEENRSMPDCRDYRIADSHSDAVYAELRRRKNATLGPVKMFNPFTERVTYITSEAEQTKAMLDGYIAIDSPTTPKEEKMTPPKMIDPTPEPVTAPKSTPPKKPKLAFTKTDVAAALKNVDVLNAAIAHLGDLQTADELEDGTATHSNQAGFSAAFARTGRYMWMWVTGKDPKTMNVRWDPKCISHSRSNTNRTLSRYISNYDNITTAVELAEYVVSFHWRQLEHILDSSFVGVSLPKVDPQRTAPAKPQGVKWVSLQGARVLQVRGKGTQLLWDSRRIWLPSSKLQTVNGVLSIPRWLAARNSMV